jgi:Ca2+-binding RTX toxin-like protein
MADTAHTLAEIAASTYDTNPAAGLPSGFTAVNLPNLGMAGGVFVNDHALALIGQGLLDGEQVLVVAIRGTDDAYGWVADVGNIDAEYGALKPLAAALEAYAAGGGKVVLTGHSMGGAMDQIFMAEHPNDDNYRAVTFGSPGALPEQGVFSIESDARITNYAVSDDPFVFLGEHRAEVASYAVKNLAAGVGLATELASVTHLTAATLLPTIRDLGADYVNNGSTLTLAGAGSPLTLDSLAHANLSEHEPSTYVALTGADALPEPSLWTTGASKSGGAGDDNLIASAGGGNATLSGGDGDDTLTAGLGDSSLSGGMGNDLIRGGPGFDNVNGNQGDDTISGGSGGGDWLLGGQGNDLISSQHGADFLNGNLGNDTLNGGDGNDIIRGGQGDDVVTGGAGNDWLSGDRGSDTLTGGTGADIFHSFAGAGADVVTDFRPGEGDRVQLDFGTTYTVAQVGQDTVIDLGAGDKMTLFGVQATSLPSGWIFEA